jgi:hypothetical protein
MKLRWNFSQRMHLIHSIGPKTHVLGVFRTISLLPEIRCKTAELVPLTHKFAKRSCIEIFCNERIRSTPLDPKLMFWGRFEPFRYCMKVGVKPAELVLLTHKFTKSICV